jgi:hypothetical protein
LATSSRILPLGQPQRQSIPLLQHTHIAKVTHSPNVHRPRKLPIEFLLICSASTKTSSAQVGAMAVGDTCDYDGGKDRQAVCHPRPWQMLAPTASHGGVPASSAAAQRKRRCSQRASDGIGLFSVHAALPTKCEHAGFKAYPI